jgi:hypothetical protein
MINVYMMFGGKVERKHPIEYPIFRWEDNIKIDIKQAMGLYIGFIGLETTSIIC